MNKYKQIKILSYVTVILTLLSAIIGFFYSTGGKPFYVENIYGESIQLFGDGIYAYDSFFKATINKGTDVAMILVSIIFLITVINYHKSNKTRFMHAGLLTGIMYYSASITFGVIYNNLFLLYLLLFSTTFFLLIISLINIIKEDNISKLLQRKKLKKTSIFLFVMGSSVLVWLSIIIPALISNVPLETIEIYTTEPSFVFDLAIILPLSIYAGIMLWKQKIIGYKIAPILMILIVIIGLIVVCQTTVQLNYGIKLEIGQLIGLVSSFVVLSIVAILVNIKFFKQL